MRRLAATAGVALLLPLAVVAQLSVLPQLGLPLATPALVLIVVAAVGCARGAAAGATAGFAGGLLLDLAPPADHPAGQWALVLTLVGYLAGRFGADPLMTAPARIGLVGALAAGGTVGYIALAAALGAGWPAGRPLPLLVAAAGAYALALAVPLLPALRWALSPPADPPAARW